MLPPVPAMFLHARLGVPIGRRGAFVGPGSVVAFSTFAALAVGRIAFMPAIAMYMTFFATVPTVPSLTAVGSLIGTSGGP